MMFVIIVCFIIGGLFFAVFAILLKMDMEPVISGVMGFCVTTIAIGLLLVWVSMGERAKIINKQYGTIYTANDMFYSGDVIENTIYANNFIHTEVIIRE